MKICHTCCLLITVNLANFRKYKRFKKQRAKDLRHKPCFDFTCIIKLIFHTAAAYCTGRIVQQEPGPSLCLDIIILVVNAFLAKARNVSRVSSWWFYCIKDWPTGNYYTVWLLHWLALPVHSSSYHYIKFDILLHHCLGSIYLLHTK